MHVIALKFRVYHVLCGGMFVCKCLGGIRTQNVRVASKMMNMAYLRRVGSIVALLRYRTGTVQYLITVLVHAVEIIFCDNKNCHVPESITNPENTTSKCKLWTVLAHVCQISYVEDCIIGPYLGSVTIKIVNKSFPQNIFES
jgi:hypothetical protein